jgi:DNA-binding NarL/FixJ family response regulator
MLTRSRSKVAVYGDSMLIAGVESILRDQPAMDVVRVNPDEQGLRMLADLAPDVILFDATAAEANFALPFLQRHPDFMLIGLNLHEDTAFVMSSRSRCVATPTDLAQIILAGDAHSDHRS